MGGKLSLYKGSNWQLSLEYNKLDFEKPNEENNNGEENGDGDEAGPEKFIYYNGEFYYFEKK